MPYKLDGNCVIKADTGKVVKCHPDHASALAHLRALEANVPDAKMDQSKAKDPANFAYVPDEKSPSTWKLDISDRQHVGLAIAALSDNPPHGNKVQIPADAKAGVLKRIRAAIAKFAKDDADKKQLLADLGKVKSLVDAKWMQMLSQDEVNYTPLTTNVGRGCANCRWFMVGGMEHEGADCCHLVIGYPEPILPTGYCDRQEIKPVPVQPEAEPIPVVIVEPPEDETDSQEMALPTDRKGLKALVFDIVKGFIAQPPEETAKRPFAVFKGKDGEHYWLARHTGKYVDREDEIIADKAHEEYVARVQKGLVPMPELWTWHKKGTMHGQADFVWKSGGFVLALGHFVGTEAEKARAVAYYQKHGDKIKLSHMFKFPHNGKQNKVYYAYNTVEITTLPDGAEAFPYTSFEELGTMPFTKQQEEMIRGIGGDEMLQRAQAADTKAQAETAKMDAAGVSSKNFDNFEGSTIPGADELKALGVSFKDMDGRLKSLEALPALVAGLEGTIKAMIADNAALRESVTQSLTKANANEQKLLEYQAVKPPASKSDDTLLNERERSLIEQFANQAKQVNQKSLIDQMFGEAPVVSG